MFLRLANLAVAAWGAGTALVGQRARCLVLGFAGQAVDSTSSGQGCAGSGGSPASSVLVAFDEISASNVLVAVVLPLLHSGSAGATDGQGSACSPDAAGSRVESTAAACQRAAAAVAAQWILDGLRCLHHDCLSREELATGSAQPRLDSWLALAFTRVQQLRAAAPAVAALTLALGPPQLVLAPAALAAIQQHLHALVVEAPPRQLLCVWQDDEGRGASPWQPSACLLHG